MSKDHVLPEALGYNLTIVACKDCNDRLGAEVDVLLTRRAQVRMFHGAIYPGATALPKHSDRCYCEAVLDDGRRLKGWAYATVSEDGNSYKFEFTPKGMQDDGSRWIARSALNSKDIPNLPQDINIYPPVGQNVQLSFLPGLKGERFDRKADLRIVAKAVLGAIAWSRGAEVLSGAAGSLLRNALWGNDVAPATAIPTEWERGIWFNMTEGRTLTPGKRSCMAYIASTIEPPFFGTICMPGFCRTIVPSSSFGFNDMPFELICLNAVDAEGCNASASQ